MVYYLLNEHPRSAANRQFRLQGVLFRLDPDGQLHRVLTGITTPNGMSWSRDNRTMYFTDTQEKTIFTYDFDEATGAITNRKPFFTVEGGGGPDGHAQDENGNLWVAVWGQWKVVRVSPQGQVTGEIKVPTRCPSVRLFSVLDIPRQWLTTGQAVAFAGEDVYITSEEEHKPEKYPESLRYHGGVFKCHVGVQGQKQVAADIQT